MHKNIAEFKQVLLFTIFISSNKAVQLTHWYRLLDGANNLNQ